MGFVQSEPRFGHATLVMGPESLLVERNADRLVREAAAERPDAHVVRITASGLDEGTLIEATGGSLFAPATIAVVDEISEASADLVAPLVALASGPGEDLALVLTHPGGVKGKGLVDKLKKARVPVIDCKALKPYQLADFAQGEARDLGGRIDKATAELLVSALGADIRQVAAGVRQLLDDTNERVITEAAVRRYFAGRADVTSFAVADHVMAGQRDQALGALRWALDTGVSPVAITSALASSLRNLGRYLDLPDPRMREYDIAAALGVPPFKVKFLRAQASNWTQRGVADAIGLVAEADAAVKGAAVDAEYAVERVVIAVTGLRGRRPGSTMGR